MSMFSRILGTDANPALKPNAKPVADVPAFTPMQELYREAMRFTSGHPEVVSGYMQASALFRVAEEIKALRDLLHGGEGALTIGVEEIHNDRPKQS